MAGRVFEVGKVAPWYLDVCLDSDVVIRVLYMVICVCLQQLSSLRPLYTFPRSPSAGAKSVNPFPPCTSETLKYRDSKSNMHFS